MSLLRTRDGRIEVLTLNRPAAANALDAATHEALLAALAAAGTDDATHGVVLTGAGERVFCAGADIKEMAARDATDPGAAHDASRRLLRTLLALIDFGKPLVCAMQGHAAGAGAMLALACDEIVAVPEATLRFPEVGLGMPSPMSVAMIEPRAPDWVRRLVQHGERVDARTALGAGLLDAVRERASLLPDAVARATAAPGGPAWSVNERWMARDLRRRLIEAADESARLRGATPGSET
jgi:enoyl-CoA hydratase/carnithine racemase